MKVFISLTYGISAYTSTLQLAGLTDAFFLLSNRNIQFNKIHHS